jgi:hypothetical protein
MGIDVMGTRSAIGIQYTDGTITAVYCHWDGYPDHNGLLLQTYYNDAYLVEDLVSYGDISSLGRSVGEKHDFDKRGNGDETTFYGRDRGDKDVDCQYFKNVDEMVDYYVGCDYFYLFKEGTWFCANNDEGEWKSLKEILTEIA